MSTVIDAFRIAPSSFVLGKISSKWPFVLSPISCSPSSVTFYFFALLTTNTTQYCLCNHLRFFFCIKQLERRLLMKKTVRQNGWCPTDQCCKNMVKFKMSKLLASKKRLYGSFLFFLRWLSRTTQSFRRISLSVLQIDRKMII